MEEAHKELTLTRVLNAPRETVWKYWTDETLMTKWWGPNGVTVPTCRLDPKPNGEIYIVMLAGETLGPMKGQEWPMTGTFQTLEKPAKIVYTSEAILNGKPFLEAHTTVTLEEIGSDKTKMIIHIVITKTTPQASGALAGMETGWNQQLDKLTTMFV